MYFPIGWSKTSKIRLKSKLHKSNKALVNGKLLNGISFSNIQNHFDEKLKLNGAANELNIHQEKQINQYEINDEESLLLITANTDSSCFCVLTNFSLRIWFCKPSVEIVSHFRNEKSLNEFGFNLCAAWRPDSKMIIVQTTKDYLLFYEVSIRNDNDEVLILKDTSYKKKFNEYYTNDKIPAIYLKFFTYTKIPNGISSIITAEEEAIICTKNCEIIGINWDGTIDKDFIWNLKETNYKSSNPNLNKQDSSNSDSLYYVSDIKYSSAIGGFSLVFANGKSAFLPLMFDEEIEENDYKDTIENNINKKYSLKQMQFVNETECAIVTSVNHKYKILAFGLKNSEAILCCIDEATTNVLTTHRLTLSQSSFPNVQNTIGGLMCLQWSPDSTVLCGSWEKGGFAIWSVFGSLLSCSLGWDYGSSLSLNKKQQNIFSSLSWGREGFQLWFLEISFENSDDNELNYSNSKHLLKKKQI